ncbi:FtsX-like permease family protein [Cutibacterium acnes]|uniref:FtsX-like permease family protein n=1 Tax=Cutibacterium acnes TaxID=1747 RepID=UPI0001F0A004|nr:FtsX-like permease family protein [Cutibacterium acnes]EFS82246.1 efflux ABC transporter, permease protein [Cutibacterium acnes HL050PA1]EFS83735.1 efflux ABC transporter, permease protein [Cutibacterium acnes HL050PA3]
MRELTVLSVRLVRQHLTLYLGCLATIVATAALTSAEAGLVHGFSDITRVHVAGFSTEEVATQLPGIRSILTLLAGLAIAISGVLMITAIRQVIASRQEELAMMRLTGASRGLLARMIASESFILGLLAGLPGALIGAALTYPLFRGMQAVGFFGRTMTIDFRFPVGSMFAVTGLIATVAATAGCVATRISIRGDLLASIAPMARRMSWWQIAWRFVLILTGVVSLVVLDPQGMGTNIILILPILAVVPLLAAAPLAMPIGAWVVGRIVGLFAPGPGKLAARRAAKDRMRYARLVTPAIISCGILGGFLVANAPDEQMRTQALTAQVAADTVITTNLDDATPIAKALGHKTRQQSRLASRYRVAGGTRRMWHFTDAPAFAKLTNLHITAGDMSRVTGTNIASGIGNSVGDRIAVVDNTGHPVTLTVVAVFTDEVYEGLIFDWGQISALGPKNTTATIFTKGLSTGEVRSVLQSEGISGTVFDKTGFVQYMSDLRRANTYRSNVGLFASVYLMCLIGVIQTTISNGLSRRKEFQVLRSLGVSRLGILATVGVEAAILQVVTGILVFSVILALGFRFASNNGTSAWAAVSAALPTTAGAFCLIAVLTVVAQLIGSQVSLRYSSN